jgi:hypothetical protein
MRVNLVLLVPIISASICKDQGILGWIQLIEAQISHSLLKQEEDPTHS